MFSGHQNQYWSHKFHEGCTSKRGFGNHRDGQGRISGRFKAALLFRGLALLKSSCMNTQSHVHPVILESYIPCESNGERWSNSTSKADDKGSQMWTSDGSHKLCWRIQATVVINHTNVPLHYLHHGLTLASSLAPHSCSLTAPSGMGEITGGNEARKLTGWNKNSLIRKAKAMHMSKAKHETPFPLSMGRQAFCHPQENPSWVMVIWEDKNHHFKCSFLCPYPPSSPSFICQAWHQKVQDFPWVSWSQLSCLCTLELPAFPSPPCWWGGVRTRKDLATVQTLLSSD